MLLERNQSVATSAGVVKLVAFDVETIAPDPEDPDDIGGTYVVMALTLGDRSTIETGVPADLQEPITSETQGVRTTIHGFRDRTSPVVEVSMELLEDDGAIPVIPESLTTTPLTLEHQEAWFHLIDALASGSMARVKAVTTEDGLSRLMASAHNQDQITHLFVTWSEQWARMEHRISRVTSDEMEILIGPDMKPAGLIFVLEDGAWKLSERRLGM